MNMKLEIDVLKIADLFPAMKLDIWLLVISQRELELRVC